VLTKERGNDESGPGIVTGRSSPSFASKMRGAESHRKIQAKKIWRAAHPSEEKEKNKEHPTPSQLREVPPLLF